MAASYSMCLCSRQNKNNPAARQGRADPFFNGQLFSGTDTERNKPYPDVYLAAAQALNVDIKDCAIIEDSITGVTAGFSSGATVYAYCPEGEDPEPLLQAGAQHIFHHMQHLPLLLQDKTSNKS